jgi:hypothetical protein
LLADAENRARILQWLRLIFERLRGGRGFFRQRGILLGDLVHLHIDQIL